VQNTNLERLRLAYLFARQRSDDPDTQNGAVLVSADGHMAYGANRLPSGVCRRDDRLVRPTKYVFLEHAERDAIFSAAATGVRTRGATLYCPWFACPDCARAIIQAGVAEVVGHERPFSLTPDRWIDSIEIARMMLDEAGVLQTIIGGDVGVSIRFDGRDVVM